IRVCHHGESDFGRAWLSAWGPEAALKAWIGAIGPTEPFDSRAIERMRIENLRPRAGREITETFNPLEVGLKDSIADSKGCYPGQEVIEKIIALGSPARRLARIDGHGAAPAPGDKILNLAEP